MTPQQLHAEADALFTAHKIRNWVFYIKKEPSRLYGQCNHRKRQIWVNGDMLEHCTDEEILDTLRHEVAHILAGPTVVHGQQWRYWAIKLGASPTATSHTKARLPARYVASCTHCGKQHWKHRLPRRRERQYYCLCNSRDLIRRTPLTYKRRESHVEARAEEQPSTVESQHSGLQQKQSGDSK